MAKQYRANWRIRGMAKAGEVVEMEEEKAAPYVKSGTLTEVSAKEAKKAEGNEEAPKASDELPDDFLSADGLREAGFHTYADVIGASDEDLTQANGVGDARVKQIRKRIKDLGIQ
jgi:DNA-directed RNA polymerase alpha subunit